HFDVAEGAPQLFGTIGSAVRAVVVDDKNVRVGYRGAATSQELLDVVALLVRRRDDQSSHSSSNLTRALPIQPIQIEICVDGAEVAGEHLLRLIGPDLA